MTPAVSTACLYPKPTEDALYDLCLNGVQTVEIFLNTPSETKAVFAGDLAAMMRRFGVRCCAVHPWTAPQEGYMLFSQYTRRCADFLDETRRVFDVMQRLGAKYYVLHGAPAGFTTPGLYCERFHMLAEAAKPFGITVTQENVVKFESQSLRFLKEFCRTLGDEARLTLDVKQALRSKVELPELVHAVGSHVVHVHLSDNGPAGDCLRIGKGRMQTAQFLRSLREKGFDGAVTLELYREAFSSAADLAEDYQKIGRLIRIAEK